MQRRPNVARFRRRDTSQDRTFHLSTTGEPRGSRQTKSPVFTLQSRPKKPAARTLSGPAGEPGSGAETDPAGDLDPAGEPGSGAETNPAGDLDPAGEPGSGAAASSFLAEATRGTLNTMQSGNGYPASR